VAVVFPALLDLLVGSIPRRPLQADMFLSIVTSGAEAGVIEFLDAPNGRFKRSVLAIAQFLWAPSHENRFV